MSDQPIRVGIRGVSGHLGRRFIQILQYQEDMVFTLGLLRDDPMKSELETVLTVMAALGRPLRGTFAEDGDILGTCDVLVDATAPRVSQGTRLVDVELGIPVILQCSEDAGRLIALPRMEPGSGSLWRQGDCLLTGLAPVIAPFADHLVGVRADVVMQYAKSLNTYPMKQRIQGTYLAPRVAKVFEEGLNTLFPRAETVKTNVRLIPALDYYTAHLELTLDRSIDHASIVEILEQAPRACLLPSGVTSTYEVDHLIREPVMMCRRDLSPITVFRDTMIPAEGARDTRTIELDVAIYSCAIAVYGNIDAIRLIARGAGNITPEEAMRATDAYAHLVTSFA